MEKIVRILDVFPTFMPREELGFFLPGCAQLSILYVVFRYYFTVKIMKDASDSLNHIFFVTI